MTKRKSSDEWEGSEWLSGQFSPSSLPSSAGSSCDYCHESFGFFWWMSGGRKTCHFCGYQIHSRCSSVIPNGNNGRKIRICQRCRKYKYDSSKLLIEGDEFISYTGRIPSACYLCLSEVECSLLLRIDPSNVEEKISLSEVVSIQRGFSHAGHMRAASLYDPLRCFSININTCNGHKTYDLKAESLSHCEKWIKSLNVALEVYRKLKEQQRIEQNTTGANVERESANAKSKNSPSPSPTLSSDSHTSSSCSSSTREERLTQRRRRRRRESPEVVLGDGKSLEIYEQDDMVVVDVTSDYGTACGSSREATPTSEPGDPKHSPVILQRSHYKIRTINAPHRSKVNRNSRNERFTATVISTRSSPDWRTDSSSSHGLPYKGKKSPLASNCACHAYAIESPRDFLFPFSKNIPNDPFQSCCELCRGKCKVAHDLRTF